jgi:ATP-binding cassette subfamily F protein uup
MDKIVDHLFILEVMEWSKIFRKYSDFRAYEEYRGCTKRRKQSRKKDWKQNNPTGNLTFNEQEYQK